MTHSIKAKPLTRRALQQRNQRVNQYCGLVNPIAVHYCRRCPEPLDDLVQVGLMGLLRAAELYQPQINTPFEAISEAQSFITCGIRPWQCGYRVGKWSCTTSSAN